MENTIVSQTIDLKSIPVSNSSTEFSEEESCFCCWSVKICDAINCLKDGMNSLKKALHDWWIKQYLYIWWVDRSYTKTLNDYNVSHVLEKTAGEDNTLGQGNFGKIERYGITEGATVPKVVALDNDAEEDEDPVDNYDTPARHSHDIAYKTADGSQALDNDFNKVMGKSGIKEEAKYLHNQEKKALAALDHTNIIKPVTIEGDDWQAKKMVVIGVKSFSDQEKKDLAAVRVEKEYTPKKDKGEKEIDFDFVEKPIITKPAGIPLPLADSTLRAEIETGLSAKEKDNVVRSMVGAVAYMHQHGYVHLDINPNNILKKDDVWLLCDFGCAHHYSEMYEGTMDFMPMYIKKGPRLFYGTSNYLSPQMHARLSLNAIDVYQIPAVTEAIKTGNGNYPHFETDARAADAYSLGIVLFELLTGVNPTPHNLNGKPLHKIEEIFQQNVTRLLQNHKESLGGYYDIVKSLLQSKCNNRMTVPAAESGLSQVSVPQ